MKKNNSEIYKVQALLTTGLKLHQVGNGSEAWSYYQKVLSIEPNNFDALHLCGLILAAKKTSPEPLISYPRPFQLMVKMHRRITIWELHTMKVGNISLRLKILI